MAKVSRWLSGKGDYLTCISDIKVDEIVTKLNNARAHVENVSMLDVQTFSNDIVNILTDAAIENENIKRVKTKRKLRRKQEYKPWYNKDCEVKRASFHIAKNLYRADKCDENKTAQQTASK